MSIYWEAAPAGMREVLASVPESVSDYGGMACPAPFRHPFGGESRTRDGESSNKGRIDPWTGLMRIETPDQEVVEILRAKTPQERLSIAFGMWKAARDMLISLLASSHPDWDRARLEEEVARRLSHGSV